MASDYERSRPSGVCLTIRCLRFKADIAGSRYRTDPDGLLENSGHAWDIWHQSDQRCTYRHRSRPGSSPEGPAMARRFCQRSRINLAGFDFIFDDPGGRKETGSRCFWKSTIFSAEPVWGLGAFLRDAAGRNRRLAGRAGIVGQPNIALVHFFTKTKPFSGCFFNRRCHYY